MCSQINDIRQSFASLRLDKKLRHREIAHFLQITEAELVDAHVGVSKLSSIRSSPHLARATRLKKPWQEILGVLAGLGEVLALTRNQFAVHEKIGVYSQFSIQGDVGLVQGDLDLRLFYRHWEFAYIFEEGKGDSLQRSIQFFDESGTAIHKIFLSIDSNHIYLDELAEVYADPNQDSGIQVQEKSPIHALSRRRPDVEIHFSIENFRNDWANLKDTHEFFDLLKRYGLTRLQALQLIGRHYAEPLTRASLRSVFSDAQQFEVPIMIFVGNRGVIQIHTGVINKVVEAKAWFNILDPGFNLHLDLEKIDHIWLVRKPSQDGVITSMELLDQNGEMIALVFGERKPGNSELASWRNLLEGVLEDQVNQELSMTD